MSESTNPRTSDAQRDAYPGTPRWVKVSGILFAAAVVLIALLHLSGHGPGARLHGGKTTSGRAHEETLQP